MLSFKLTATSDAADALLLSEILFTKYVSTASVSGTTRDFVNGVLAQAGTISAPLIKAFAVTSAQNALVASFLAGIVDVDINDAVTGVVTAIRSGLTDHQTANAALYVGKTSANVLLSKALPTLDAAITTSLAAAVFVESSFESPVTMSVADSDFVHRITG